MRKMLLLCLFTLGCAETSETRKVTYNHPIGSYRRAQHDASRCNTPVAWAEHTADNPDFWFAVCGDAYGNEISRFSK